MPFDLLNAMGVTSCFAEFIGGMLSAAGVAAPFLEGAEAASFLADGCAWQRTVIGAAGMGIMPRPDLVIASSSPCSAGSATAEYLAHRFDCPLFVLHVPDEGTAAGVEYLAQQFKEMTAFVIEHTGRKLDEDRLRRVVRKSNAARQAAAAVYERAQRVPSPDSTEIRTGAPQKEKLVFINNIRWLLTIFVVMIHLHVTYSGMGLWYYKEPGQMAPLSFWSFILYQCVTQAFVLGLFFFIAGYFTPGSYAKRGFGRFIRDRFIRLGIPTLVYMLALHPAAVLLTKRFSQDMPPDLASWYGRYKEVDLNSPCPY